MGLMARIRWSDGAVWDTGVIRARSRYDTSPAPSGLWTTADGTGTGQANEAYEATYTIGAGVTTSIDLLGAGSEKNLINQTLAFTKVKGVELVLTTTPAAGVSVRLGPQGVADAAQLWFQAATTNFWVEVRDRFAMLDRAVGWPLTAPAVKLPIHNPGAASVSVWVRIIGTR